MDLYFEEISTKYDVFLSFNINLSFGNLSKYFRQLFQRVSTILKDTFHIVFEDDNTNNNLLHKN